MSQNRVLKYLNWLIAVALLGLAFSLYWFVYRVLPQTAGEVKAPVGRSARVIRDSLGVPHITADSLEDGLFLQGYVTAQDRLWQMDVLRRISTGRLSELFGPRALEADREARRLRIGRIAEQHAKHLDPNLRVAFAAYARGVNYFIETHRGALPVEFGLLRYDPEPWTVTDCILVGLHMFRTLTTSWKDEVQKAALVQGGDPNLVEQLFAVRAGGEVTPGSNAWVVSGKLTADGKPLLANDTHLEFSLPSTWYMVHLTCPKLNAAGFALPGIPGVIIGHNERIAWGVTNLGYDVQDLYAERLDTRTGQYVFKGQLTQAVAEREVIPVRGQKGVPFSNYVTAHGPVWSIEGTRVLTLKWIAAQQGAFDFPFLEINAAGTWEGFRQALRRFSGPGQNFVYADVDGNIGYQAAGILPLRKAYRGDLPADGASGQYEWEGSIPFEQMPAVYNPPSGIIVTANQNPFPPSFGYSDNGVYAPYYRAHQIRELLRKRTGWKPEDMVAVQKDVYSRFSHVLAGELVKAVDRAGKGDQDLVAAANLLRSWNGQMEIGQAAPMIASLTYGQLRTAVGLRANPKNGYLYEGNMATPVIERLLRERPKEWFSDWDAVLIKALRDGLEQGRNSQGRNPAKWDYGEFVHLELNHPVISAIPYVGGWFGRWANVGSVRMSGSPTTPKQITRRVGPSMRFVAAVGNWDKSLMNLTVGESGQILSNHYKDQWEHFWSGVSFPAPFTSVRGDELKVVP